MNNDLNKLFDDALFISHSLFSRNKVTGSTANMSFIYDDKIHITGTGTCFGKLRKEDFSIISLDGEYLDGVMPSKELKLHKIMYDYWSEVKAIIHTHSFYSTLWSCLEHDNVKDVAPNYTPYLKMKLGNVGIVPYALPGSDNLFDLFQKYVHLSKGLLLQNHGVIIGGVDLMNSFYIIEELEESLKIAWKLHDYSKCNILML